MRTVSQLTRHDPLHSTGRVPVGEPKEALPAGPNLNESAQTMDQRRSLEGISQPAADIGPVLESNDEVFAAVLAGIGGAEERGFGGLELEVTIDLVFPPNASKETFERVDEICLEIARLAGLPENYDGNDELPISQDAIGAATWLVKQLNYLYGILVDTVTPLADGGVELQIENSWLYVTIWVHGTTSARFVVVRGGSSKHGDGPVFEVQNKLWNAIVEDASPDSP